MYVSPNTQSVVIQQLDTTSSHNPVGSPETVNVTSTSNGCTTSVSGTTCSITYPAPAGTFDFSVKTYDATNGTGNLLSENTLTTFTVIAGVANTISVTLNGVLASVSTPSGLAGTLSALQGLNFTPKDASGAAIIGPGTYDNGPLTISVPGGATVSKTSFNGPSDGTSVAVQCTVPGNYTITFADNSGAIGSTALSCVAEPISLAPGSLSFDTVAMSASDSTYDQQVTVSDPNPHPTENYILSCNPAGTANVVAQGPPTTAIRPLTPGTCTLQATDQYGQASQMINIEVHTTTIGIQSELRKH
jgi:hypothetical protein